MGVEPLACVLNQLLRDNAHYQDKFNGSESVSTVRTYCPKVYTDKEVGMELWVAEIIAWRNWDIADSQDKRFELGTFSTFKQGMAAIEQLIPDVEWLYSSGSHAFEGHTQTDRQFNNGRETFTFSWINVYGVTLDRVDLPNITAVEAPAVILPPE